MKRFVFILVLLAVIAAGLVEWSVAAWDGPGSPAADGKQTTILIAPGSRTHAVARMLEAKGVMKSGLMFELNLRARRLADKIKAGEYAIPSGASMAAIAKILV
ncbi:MAG TPA: endolytic transglycosylase MltG, partial [Rhizomicrobium sp.]|nr:endolytic transglycosylase MltG [Rhizomicrobium sp.]